MKGSLLNQVTPSFKARSMATGPPTSSELRTCLCGTVVSGRKATTAPPSVAATGNSSTSSSSSNVSSQKCRICRTKPKFLRNQRSLDLTISSSPLASKRTEPTANTTNSSDGNSSNHNTSQDDTTSVSSCQSGSQHSSSHSRQISQQPQRPAPTLRERRRARSAERYDGLRISRGERGTSAIPRQSSVQPISGTNASSGGSSNIRRPDQPPEYSSTEPLSLPLLNSYHNIPPPAHSPPPSYEAAMSKNLLPPSYDEYLAQKMQGLGGIGSSGSGASSMVPSGGGPPYSWRPCDHRDSGNIVPTPAPFPLSTPSRISQQNVSRAMASSYEPNQGQQGQHCCTCSKCKVRSRRDMATMMTTVEMTFYSLWKRRQQCKESSQMV